MLDRLKKYQKKTRRGIYPISVDMGISEFTLFRYYHQDKYKNLSSKMKGIIENWIEVNCV